MRFLILLSLLVLLATYIEARDKDIKDESYETEKVGYCVRGEEWKKCGTGCEKTCTNPKQPSFKKCKRPCIPHVCQCKPGLYRDNQGSGRCVKKSKCKKW